MGAIDKKSLFVLIARLILAGVFVMAALPKIQDPVAFAVSVAAFRVIDSDLSLWVALFLPWLELVLGLGILMPAIRRTSSALIGVLLFVFIVLHSSAWVRGLDISCGCFGAETGEIATDYRWLILRNALLLGAALLVFRQDSKE
ncbi:MULTISPECIES: MauE/DoxX family redox-associated membrane protein [unclassified Lentimonas]|uniref:MauE/DoxX family redox-associated membrane protein n=1 Tax=unclassified Lentimonas TaxID=2630993 RepID=UPI0013249687|nr:MULTISPECIES: MauE/DoxX family redox-associated membrane protein [unclassified Lentimonas]CAA6676592.1 Unannotated [Lentimonas sp. CC4]CAA6684745.1 Unannotated [Lentimonas sp. CC6]CAA7075381.1 Unannotated [Lentimonas sp. CC4]CAA7168956.1 Unannotated [Lentimonas sp. CC21]CAA7182210.1 Unannotated [Lentimonas sp. CC8]